MLAASKNVDLKGNIERAQCVLMSLHQNAEQYYIIKVANKFFDMVLECTYFLMSLTSENCVHEREY